MDKGPQHGPGSVSCPDASVDCRIEYKHAQLLCAFQSVGDTDRHRLYSSGREESVDSRRSTGWECVCSAGAKSSGVSIGAVSNSCEPRWRRTAGYLLDGDS